MSPPQNSRPTRTLRHCPLDVSHIRIVLSREPVAAYCPTVFASAAREAGTYAARHALSASPLRDQQSEGTTHRDAAKLPNRRVGRHRRKDRHLDDVLMAAQFGLGIAFSSIPYPGRLARDVSAADQRRFLGGVLLTWSTEQLIRRELSELGRTLRIQSL